MGLIVPTSTGLTQYETNMEASVTSNVGVACNHNGVAHTKNATWTTLIASTAFNSYMIIVSVCNNNVSNGDSSTLLDIGIGAASSESTIIPNIAAGFVSVLNAAPGVRSYIFPLFIPIGSRISGRTQSVRTTGAVEVTIQLYGGPTAPEGMWFGQRVETLGANTVNSAGTKVTPGTSGDGTAVSLGTTANPWRAMVLGVQGHPDDVSWGAGLSYWVDVGLGSSGTEWLGQDRFMMSSSSAECVGGGGPPWLPIYQNVKAGTEIMTRIEGGAAVDAMSAVVHGVY